MKNSVEDYADDENDFDHAHIYGEEAVSPVRTEYKADA